ncbi:MAG: bifunctional pyr operon transcriptional regulator/uracil phosphoribosyltransferase PyrR [Cytophagales bacterium]|nr:bifunctional pyr operon transcriptional regulator/uracil phosphoribosyltransferase PyrR [Cytophagales bacterium]
MQKKLILNQDLLKITISRLCYQLIESHNDFSNSVILGLQPRGKYVADRIKEQLESLVKRKIDVGYLDTTFHRDDFRRRDTPKKANETTIPFLIEDKNVVLVDDVLYTGRSVRAALDAMISFGRPKSVELLVLVDRKYTRDLPIQPNYIGKSVNTMQSQRVMVEWKQHGGKRDSIWLFNNLDT